MSTPNDGGPAFPFDWVDFQPTTGDQIVREQFSGMSLRDYLASHASESDVAWHRNYDPFGKAEITREEARYAFADAMMKARAK